MKRDIVWTTKFKKDYKLAIKRHMDIGLLDDIIRALSRGEKLPEKPLALSSSAVCLRVSQSLTFSPITAGSSVPKTSLAMSRRYYRG